MKLSKQKIISLTKRNLSSLGYRYIKDTVTAAQGLYIKKIDDSLFLTLGLTIHRYYESMFTASFYLSKTTRWAAMWGDIPNESYKRPGHFLMQHEREALLSEEQTKPGMKDAWWDAYDINSLANFFECLTITESRFVNQHGLFNAIHNSVEVTKEAALVKEVQERINSNTFAAALEFIPLKNIDNIPIEWFKAAESTIKNQAAILNINTVIALAADAYRQNLLLQ